jgi:hypothetical protein
MFFFLYILNVFFCVFAHYLVFLFATRLCFSAKEENRFLRVLPCGHDDFSVVAQGIFLLILKVI